MAGGKDQRDANQMLRQQNQQTSLLQNRNTQDLDESKQRANDLYSQLRTGYGSLAGGAAGADTTMVMPSGPGAGGVRTGGGGGAPPPNPNDPARGGRNALMDESLGGLRKFAETGGWDPNRVSSMDENIQQLKAFGKTGGIDATTEARMRGGGVYDEFAKTGGLSEQDRSNIRQRGNSVIPSFYGSMRNEANRMGAVQGGYGPGRSALMSRLGRQQAGAAQEAALGTELGLTNQINQGRLAGAGGMASSEQALAGLRTGNQLAGIQGAAGIESGMVNDINRGKQFGIGGIGSQGEADRAAAMGARETDLRERQIGMQGGAMAQQQANWERQFAAEQQRFGLGGLESLYGGQGSGEYNFNKGYGLDTIGAGGDMASRLKTGNKSWTDYAAPIAGAVAGGLTGGWGSLIPKKLGPPGGGQFGMPGALM